MNEPAVEVFDQNVGFDTIVVSERVELTTIEDTKIEMAEGDIAKICSPVMVCSIDMINTVTKC